MSAALPMAIDARHLTYRYGQFTAVDDVTLQVRPGETMGLLGPNGAGKTTMVRMLTTLAPVQQGELHIFGMDARRQTTDIRSNIGYVPQQLSIEPALTGRQNVEWFARLYGVPRAERSDRVDQALVAMDLLGVADRMASAYSGGMVRRLEVAQALVNRPSLLVLDEPTVGLDPIARDGVWSQVRKMQAQFGMTVLLTTHYMEEADAVRPGGADAPRRVAGRRRTRRVEGPAVQRVAGRHARGCVPPLRGNGFGRRGGVDGGTRVHPGNPFQQKGGAPCRLMAPRRGHCFAHRGMAAGRRADRPHRSIRDRRTAEVATRPDRTRHPDGAARAVAADFRYHLQPPTRHRDRIGVVSGLPGPGIIAQSALFISIFYGIQIIWDRDAGVLAKLMVTPAPASALITGKAFAAGVRSVAQVVGVMALAYLMGVGLTINPLRIAAAMGVVMLGAAFFACLSMTLAGLVRNRDRLMGIGQAITMPLFFASNALYPVDVMPAWLRALSKVNPLSYEVDALRALLIGTPFNPVGIVVLVVAAVLGITTASTLLRRLVA